MQTLGIQRRLPKVDLEALNEKGVEIKNAQGSKNRAILYAGQGSSQLPESILAELKPKAKKPPKAEKRMTVRLPNELKDQLISKSTNGVYAICDFLRAKVHDCVQNEKWFTEILPRIQHLARLNAPSKRNPKPIPLMGRLDFRLNETTAQQFSKLCEQYDVTMQAVLLFLLDDKLKRLQAVSLE